MTAPDTDRQAASEVWRCNDCNAFMGPRFRSSHERICVWAGALEAEQVERLLSDLGLTP